MKLNLLNIEGGKSGTVEVSDKIMNLKFNHKLVKYVIDWQLNHQKPRTAKTKQRNEVKGSIPGSKNSTILVRQSIKNVRRKTLAEKIEAKAKAAAASKGKK